MRDCVECKKEIEDTSFIHMAIKKENVDMWFYFCGMECLIKWTKKREEMLNE